MKQFAFVFPGQGSQSVGMLDAWGDLPIVRDAVQEASDALGENLGRLIAEGPKEDLALTTNTQPVMLLVGVVAYRAWIDSKGSLPSVVAGHSLGEYAALVAAGSLTLTQAIPLVRLRAQAMQEAVPVGQGAMAAVLGMASDQVIEVCAQSQATFGADSGEVVQAVNFNDPMQTVIAGTKAAVEQAMVDLKAAGAKRALPLPVSAPFHSRLMKPAADRLAQALIEVDLKAPRIPLINNVDVLVQSDVSAIKDSLVRQAYNPVRWVETMHEIQRMGVSAVVECGPGKVLAGMSKRILPEMACASLYDPTTLDEVKELLTS